MVMTISKTGKKLTSMVMTRPTIMATTTVMTTSWTSPGKPENLLEKLTGSESTTPWLAPIMKTVTIS